MSRLLVGIDEAGIGCLAGPLVVAAAGLREDIKLPRTVRDSKKLSDNQREDIGIKLIREYLEFFYIEEVSAKQINALKSVWLAWERAVQRLLAQIEEHHSPDRVILDGNRRIPNATTLQYEVKADARFVEVSAASILAKNVQCKSMINLHVNHPRYGFDHHRGYGTKEHLQALNTHGVLDAHRRFYKPVRALLDQQRQLQLPIQAEAQAHSPSFAAPPYSSPSYSSPSYPPSFPYSPSFVPPWGGVIRIPLLYRELVRRGEP